MRDFILYIIYASKTKTFLMFCFFLFKLFLLPYISVDICQKLYRKFDSFTFYSLILYML